MKRLTKQLICIICLMSKYSYSQIEFKEYESLLCIAQIWNEDSCKYVKYSSKESCYSLWMGNDKQDSVYISIVNYDDSAKDNHYYKVYEELDGGFLHWVYLARDLDTNETVWIHYFRTHPHNVVRVDYSFYSIRYIDDIEGAFYDENGNAIIIKNYDN